MTPLSTDLEGLKKEYNQIIEITRVEKLKLYESSRKIVIYGVRDSTF